MSLVLQSGNQIALRSCPEIFCRVVYIIIYASRSALVAYVASFDSIRPNFVSFAMEDLNKLKVTDLKAELKKRGLPAGGLKAQLVERLQEAITAEHGDGTEKSEPEAGKDGVAEGKGGEVVEKDNEMGKKDGSPRETDKSRGIEAVAEEAMLHISSEGTKERDAPKVPNPPKSPSSMPPADKDSQSPTTVSISKEPGEEKDERAEEMHLETPEAEKLPASEPHEKATEEPVANHRNVGGPVTDDMETRKRKRDEEPPIPEPPLSSSKRAKPASPAHARSRTPDASPPRRMVPANQTPSLHPPTKAIYITCLSRPLNVTSFTNHITSLTSSKTPPTQVWLDSVKSHAYVTFANEEDASAVRGAMNGISWPPNEKRRELSVDFVPVDAIAEWIEREEGAKGQRFDIAYVSRQGIVTAILRATESREPRPVHLVQEGKEGFKSPPPVPTGPRASRREETPLRREERVEVRGGEKVRVLKPDELFRKTTTKPWVYWQEVAPEERERRRERRE